MEVHEDTRFSFRQYGVGGALQRCGDLGRRRRARRLPWRRRLAEESGRMSSTASEGRHRRTPSGVSTMGRLIRIGCAIMASSKPVVGQRRVAQAEFGIRRALLAQHAANRHAHAADEVGQPVAAGRRLQVLDDLRLDAGVADQGQRVAGGAAGGIVIDGDTGHDAAPWSASARIVPMSRSLFWSDSLSSPSSRRLVKTLMRASSSR